MKNKVFRNKELIDKIIKLKNENKIVGFTNGCFDLFHRGHLRLLQESKNSCDFLIVGINSDSSVKKLKGLSRPIDNIKTRIKNLSIRPEIDGIIIFSSITPLKIIKEIRPDILFKGSDYKDKLIIGKKEVMKNNGKVILIKIIDDISTTSIINNKINYE